MKIDIPTLKFWIGEKILIDDVINNLTTIGFETFLEHNLLNISIPYNRSNCNNIFALLNELSGLMNLNFFKKRQRSFNLKYKKCNKFKIKISDKNFCYFYSLIFIEHIDNTRETPENIKNMLIANNINLNNFIVDTLNYASLITGQPYHAYDAEKVYKQINITKLKEDSLFFTINNKPIKLEKDCFVIKDYHNTILALPGIIGSNFSKTTKNSTQCLIELAIFNKDEIKKIKNHYNIITTSSEIFEKGVNIHNKKIALNFLLSLLNTYHITYRKTYHKDINSNNNTLILHKQQITNTLGFIINDIIIEKILKKKFFKFKNFQHYWQIIIPYDRYDITIPENIIAEILKYHGYNNIPMISTNTHVDTEINMSIILKKNITDYLMYAGFNEVINYSFVNYDIEKLISPNNFIFIKNPISEHMSIMRTSLLQGLLKNMVLNINKGEKNLHFFEIGNVWCSNNHVSNLKLSCISTDLYYNNSNTTEKTFYILKGFVENICIKILKINTLTFQCKSNNYLNPTISTDIFKDKKHIGAIGLINNTLLKFFSIKHNIYFMELDLTSILNKFPTTQFNDISKYPKIERDISFIILNKINYIDLLLLIEEKHITDLKNIHLISIYNIDDNHKSITIRFTFQSLIKTLEDKMITAIITDICNTAQNKLSAIIKGF